MATYPMLDPRTFSLPSGESVSCGLRKDLPKKERRHEKLDAGMDVRHSDAGYFLLMRIYICARCGRDEMHKPTWTVALPGR